MLAWTSGSPFVALCGKCSIKQNSFFQLYGTPKRLWLWARSLGLFWNETRQNGNDQNCRNMKQDKTIVPKMDWKLTASFLSQAWWDNSNLSRMRCYFGQPFCYCQVTENFFIQLILFIHSAIVPHSRIYGNGINYHSKDSAMRTGNSKKRAKKPFQVFSFQNGSQKTRPVF